MAYSRNSIVKIDEDTPYENNGATVEGSSIKLVANSSIIYKYDYSNEVLVTDKLKFEINVLGEDLLSRYKEVTFVKVRAKLMDKLVENDTDEYIDVGTQEFKIYPYFNTEKEGNEGNIEVFLNYPYVKELEIEIAAENIAVESITYQYFKVYYETVVEAVATASVLTILPDTSNIIDTPQGEEIFRVYYPDNIPENNCRVNLSTVKLEGNPEYEQVSWSTSGSSNTYWKIKARRNGKFKLRATLTSDSTKYAEIEIEIKNNNVTGVDIELVDGTDTVSYGKDIGIKIKAIPDGVFGVVSGFSVKSLNNNVGIYKSSSGISNELTWLDVNTIIYCTILNGANNGRIRVRYGSFYKDQEIKTIDNRPEIRLEVSEAIYKGAVNVSIVSDPVVAVFGDGDLEVIRGDGSIMGFRRESGYPFVHRVNLADWWSGVYFKLGEQLIFRKYVGGVPYYKTVVVKGINTEYDTYIDINNVNPYKNEYIKMSIQGDIEGVVKNINIYNNGVIYGVYELSSGSVTFKVPSDATGTWKAEAQVGISTVSKEFTIAEGSLEYNVVITPDPVVYEKDFRVDLVPSRPTLFVNKGNIKIYYPNGNQYGSYDMTIEDNYSMYYRTRISDNNMIGKARVEVKYEGVVYSKEFEYIKN